MKRPVAMFLSMLIILPTIPLAMALSHTVETHVSMTVEESYIVTIPKMGNLENGSVIPVVFSDVRLMEDSVLSINIEPNNNMESLTQQDTGNNIKVFRISVDDFE